MEGVIISQIHWPVKVYEWLQDTAYKKRQSMNKTIVELVEEFKKQNNGVEIES